MTNVPNTPRDLAFERLAAGFFDQTLDAAELDRFRDLLRDDDARVRRFAELAQLNAMIGHEVAYQERNILFAGSADPEAADAANVLVELAKLEGAAEAQPVVLNQPRRKPIRGSKTGPSISLREAASLGGYLISNWTRSHAAAVGGVAAALLLGVVLLFVLSPNNETTTANAPTASATQSMQQNPGNTQSTPTPIVATLTAQRDAAWATQAAAAIAAAGELRAGDRLTLTQGFAEITTSRGAIAIIQAPATVEFTDSNNAIRLHAGKLMGICETQSSKGFVVRTPHMDVTDLSTRFGVAIDADNQTLAQVFQGSVEARPTANTLYRAKPVLLTQGETLAINASGQAVDNSAFDPEVFAKLVTQQDGFAQLTGNARFVSSAAFIGRDRRSLPTHSDAQVFEELRSVTLRDPIAVSFHMPGLYQHYGFKDENYAIPPGSMIRSYIVLLNRGAHAEATRAFTSGDITFDGPVVGVIATREHHQSFVDAMASVDAPAWKGAGDFRGPNLLTKQSDIDPDRVALDNTRRVLNFRFVNEPAGTDASSIRAFRVLVAEEDKP